MYDLARSGHSWTYSVIYNDFAEDGTGSDGGPTGDLVMDAQGNIFGTTFGAGARGVGDHAVAKTWPLTGVVSPL